MTKQIKSNSKRYMMVVFAMTTTFFWFSLYAYVPELATYGESLGASYRMIGIIAGSYGLTQLIFRIPLGIVSDAIGRRKPFILFGLMISLLSSMVTFISPTPISLLMTRLLAGLSASTWVVFTVLFASYFRKEEAKKSIGIINAFNAIGQLVAMTIGGYVSWRFGTRYLYLLAAVGAMISFILGVFITDVNHDKMKVSLKAYISVIGDKRLLLVSLLAILSQLITFATAYGFVPILAKNIGASGLQLSFLTILSIVPGVFISVLAGDFFPKTIGVRATLVTGFLASSILCAIMPWIASLKVLYGVQFLSGISRSMVFPLLMGLCIENCSLEERARTMGTFQALYGIGMVFGPILLGSIAQSFGLTVGFGFTGAVGLIGIILTWRLLSETSEKVA